MHFDCLTVAASLFEPVSVNCFIGQHFNCFPVTCPAESCTAISWSSISILFRGHMKKTINTLNDNSNVADRGFDLFKNGYNNCLEIFTIYSVL